MRSAAAPSREGSWRDVVATVLGAAIFLAVFEDGPQRRAMAGVLVAFIAIGWTRQGLPAGLDHQVSIAYQTLTAIFLWAAVWVILRSLFARRRSAPRTSSAPSAGT